LELTIEEATPELLLAIHIAYDNDVLDSFFEQLRQSPQD